MDRDSSRINSEWRPEELSRHFPSAYYHLPCLFGLYLGFRPQVHIIFSFCQQQLRTWEMREHLTLNISIQASGRYSLQHVYISKFGQVSWLTIYSIKGRPNADRRGRLPFLLMVVRSRQVRGLQGLYLKADHSMWDSELDPCAVKQSLLQELNVSYEVYTRTRDDFVAEIITTVQ